MPNVVDANEVELHRVCELILQGRTQFADGDLIGAENTFVHLKQTAQTDAARNCGRIHLGAIYERQHIPGKFRDAAEDWTNRNWMTRAIREYEDLLDDRPTAEQRACAEQNLAAIFKLRDMES